MMKKLLFTVITILFVSTTTHAQETSQKGNMHNYPVTPKAEHLQQGVIWNKDMIKVSAKFVIKHNKIDEFKAVVAPLVDTTRKQDKGCIAYEVFQDNSNKNTFVFIETWESQEALNQHIASPHFSQAMKQIIPMLEQGVTSNIMSLVK